VERVAVVAKLREGAAEEAADLIYHLYVLLAVAGVDVADVEDVLARRSGAGESPANG